MHLALGLVVLVVVVSVVAAASRRLGVSAPLVLVLTGVVGAYLPFVPEVRLEPELVLVGVLPPLLYAAAIRMSLTDLKINRRSIGMLSVGYVGFSTVLVGAVAWWLVPAPFSWPAAFALGAVLAPPDAVAATAVARKVGMPRGVVGVLEGESLVNDATALVCLAAAVTAVTTTVTVGWFAWHFVLSIVGGVVVGLLVAVLVGALRRRVHDPVLGTVLSLLAPFVAYLPAERVHASGVLAVVVTGLMLGQRSPLDQSGASRLAEASNWRTVQFVLENAVFLLIGLQLPFVLRQARAELPDRTIVAVCLALLATVLVGRIVWVMTGTALVGLVERWLRTPVWAWTQSAVVAWAGMRGVVTLAAAFSLPAQVPRRGLILLVAFVVVVGTLVLQGLTLPWLVRRLGLRGPSPAEDALQLAALLTEVVRAGRDRLDAEPTDGVPSEVLDELGSRSVRRADTAWERLGRSNQEYEPPTAAYLRLRLAMLKDERVAVVLARDAGRYDQEVLHQVQSMLDVEESLLDRVELEASAVQESLEAVGPTGGCEHLDAAPIVVVPLTPQGCAVCLREGTSWVHLRMCLTCGEVGCCDSSPGQHARRHFEQTGHPVIRSFEPGETWRWCFVDDLLG